MGRLLTQVGRTQAVPSSLPLDYFYMGHTLNFGHRGASHDAPANTLASFELAARYGADGVELDVQLTRDGHLVVIHDYTVDGTTDGRGFVAEKTLDEIKELDAGSYFNASFAGQRVPTLDEVFEAVGDRLLFNIELKGITFRPDGMETRVADVIARHDMGKRVIISSFNPLRLRWMRRAAPQIPIGFLHMRSLPAHQWWAAEWLTWGLHREADNPRHSEITGEYMAKARRRNLRVNAWVVDDPDRMAALRDLGVDMIITDCPDVLRSVLQGER
jgi:glycerophosphoryl diester phosphodiesterase